MEISQSALARLFFYAFFTGIILGLFYDVLRLSRVLLGHEETPRIHELRARIRLPLLPPSQKRKTRRHLGILLFLEDFFFCVVSSILIILLFYEWNRGNIRIPALICAAVGFFCYRCTLGRVIVRISDLIAFAIGILLQYTFFFLTFPMRLLFHTLKRGSSALAVCIRSRLEARARRRMTAAEQKRLQREDIGSIFGLSKER